MPTGATVMQSTQDRAAHNQSTRAPSPYSGWRLHVLASAMPGQRTPAMKVYVAFTTCGRGLRPGRHRRRRPSRATSTITQALASGYSRALCCSAVEQARAAAAQEGDAALGAERKTVRIPRLRLRQLAERVRRAGGRAAPPYVDVRQPGCCWRPPRGATSYSVGSLLNLSAVVAAARVQGSRRRGEVLAAAGVLGELARTPGLRPTLCRSARR